MMAFKEEKFLRTRSSCAMSIHLEMILARKDALISVGNPSCFRTRQVVMTRNDTALNCSTVATTLPASRSREDLSLRRDHTDPKH